MIEGRKDDPTVTPEGARLAPRIAGVDIKPVALQLDERGELCEIYNPVWGFDDDPLVYVYQTMVRPGMIKGWVYHREQNDRLFVSTGTLKIVLYDPREDSPTKGMVNEIFLSDRNRGLLKIPKLVLHAVQNIGTADATFINMPNKPYNHANPDKYRLPLDSKTIPYTFESGRGW